MLKKELSLALFCCLQGGQLSKQPASKTHTRNLDQGFALPLALGLGFVMVILGLSTMIIAQSDRISAFNRKESGASLAIAEGGMARTLAQLTAPNNAVLLNRNYDTINPRTGKTYLGNDGILNSGDEQTSAIDEWAGYDPSTQPCYQSKGWGSPNFQKTGSMGATGTYTLKAYRYNPDQQKGTLLVEASKDGKTTGVVITIAVTPDLDNFPGIALMDIPSDKYAAGVIALRGREILGNKGNIYYAPAASADPSLTESAAPGEANREGYLNAIWSSTPDGVSTDTVQGEIFACALWAELPGGPTGTNVGTINTSTTLTGNGGNSPTLYEVNQIDLSNNDTLTVDTTNGPVQIDIPFTSYSAPADQAITLRNNAKILNVRTDGKPPRVGDLRILARGNSRIQLYDQTCIQNAFLWFRLDELRFLTTGPGCPGGQNTNIEGVLWMEAILSSKNEATHRDVEYFGYAGGNYDTTTKSGVTSGIAVPEDVSSLVDLLKYINLPTRYRFGGVQQWQRVRL